MIELAFTFFGSLTGGVILAILPVYFVIVAIQYLLKKL